MPNKKLCARHSLRAGTVAAALLAGAAILVPSRGEPIASAGATPTTTTSTTAPKAPAIKTLTIPALFNLKETPTISFVCPADAAVDGKVPVAVTADNLDEGSKTIATYNVASQAKVSFAPVSGGVQVNLVWSFPGALKPGTGLRITAACTEKINLADEASFAQAETSVVVPAPPVNKFVQVRNFTASAKQGAEVTFNVECAQPATGQFALKNAKGDRILHTSDYYGDDKVGIVSIGQSKTGFDVVVAIPAGLAIGSYTANFSCASDVISDVVPRWKYYAPSTEPLTLQNSPAMPFTVTKAKLPPTL